MALDISSVTSAFDIDMVIVAVLAIAGVLIGIAGLLVACLHVLALVRGDRWALAYLSKGAWQKMGFDSAEDHNNYRQALRFDDEDHYWKRKKYERGNR